VTTLHPEETTGTDDEQALRRLMSRYLVAIDRRDVSAFVETFTDDAVIRFPGVTVRGSSEIRETFSRQPRRANPVPELAGFSSRLTMHAMTTMVADVRGDQALTETYATAHLCGERDGREVILIRGLRYLDRALRTEAGWRIADRDHVVDWMYQVDAVLLNHPRFERAPDA
jgi:ketosteroid isomerase-like protein